MATASPSVRTFYPPSDSGIGQTPFSVAARVLSKAGVGGGQGSGWAAGRSRGEPRGAVTGQGSRVSGRSLHLGLSPRRPSRRSDPAARWSWFSGLPLSERLDFLAANQRGGIETGREAERWRDGARNTERGKSESDRKTWT